jgi:hypothetical protein
MTMRQRCYFIFNEEDLLTFFSYLSRVYCHLVLYVLDNKKCNTSMSLGDKMGSTAKLQKHKIKIRGENI